MKFFTWLTFFLSLIYSSLNAQIKDPVKFKFDVKTLSGGEYEATLNATIDPGWHIYSKDLPPDSGIPTEMKISGSNIVPIGGTVEVGKKHDEFSEGFGVQIVYYSNAAQFKRKFKLKDPTKPATVTAEITYQTCDDRVCLAPNTLEFEKNIEAATPATSAPTKATETTPVGDTTGISTVLAQNPAPAADSVVERIDATVPTKSTTDNQNLKIVSLDYKNPIADCGSAVVEQKDNYWTYLKIGRASCRERV